MTQSTKFPDEKAIEFFKQRGSNGRYTFKEAMEDMLTDYRTRTGIDLADVSEKLTSGTHVLVPKRLPDEAATIVADEWDDAWRVTRIYEACVESMTCAAK